MEGLTDIERRIVDHTHTLIRQVYDKLLAEIEKLRAEVAALREQRATVLADSYQGPHTRGASYTRGMLCTHRGSLFLCLHDTSDAPAESPSWKLIVKRGARARE